MEEELKKTLRPEAYKKVKEVFDQIQNIKEITEENY